MRREDNAYLILQATPVKSGVRTLPTAVKSVTSSMNVAERADMEKVRVWDQRDGSWKLVYLASIHCLKFVPVKLKGTSRDVADWEDSEEEPAPKQIVVPFRDPFQECSMYCISEIRS